MLTKTCRTCFKDLPPIEFHKSKHHREGLHSRCKPCNNIYNQKWWTINIENYKPRKRLLGWLYRNNWPDGFRILYHNCNQSLGSYGYCPHQIKDKLL